MKNYKFLNDINFPSDLRKLSEHDLQKVSDEVREEMIDAVSETGGHLGALRTTTKTFGDFEKLLVGASLNMCVAPVVSQHT